MIQLLIDTDTTPRAQLVAIIALLQQVVAARPDESTTPSAAPMGGPPGLLPALAQMFNVPTGTQSTAPAPELPTPGTFGTFETPPVAPPPATAPASTQMGLPAMGAPTANPPTPVVPPATAPAAPIAQTTGAELDKAGLPWDARIHAESKAKVADGTWRKRKNLKPGVYDGVVAELRLAYPAPASMTHTPPAAPPAPPAPPAPSAPAAPPAPPAAMVSPPTSPASPGGNMGVAPGPQNALAFRDLMVKVAGHVNAGRMSNAQLPSLVVKASGGTLTTAAQLLQNPAYIPAVDALVDECARTVAT